MQNNIQPKITSASLSNFSLILITTWPKIHYKDTCGQKMPNNPESGQKRLMGNFRKAINGSFPFIPLFKEIL